MRRGRCEQGIGEAVNDGVNWAEGSGTRGCLVESYLSSIIGIGNPLCLNWGLQAVGRAIQIGRVGATDVHVGEQLFVKGSKSGPITMSSNFSGLYSNAMKRNIIICQGGQGNFLFNSDGSSII